MKSMQCNIIVQLWCICDGGAVVVESLLVDRSCLCHQHLQLKTGEYMRDEGGGGCFPDTQRPYRSPPTIKHTHTHTHIHTLQEAHRGGSMCPLSGGLMSPPALSALTIAALITPTS